MKTLNNMMGKFIRFLHIYQCIVIGTIVVVVSALMEYFTKDIFKAKSSLSPIDNARFFPQIVFGLLIILGTILIVRGIGQIKANLATVPEGERLEQLSTQTLRSFWTLIMLFIYIYLMDKLGFCIVNVIYLVAQMTHMTKKSDRNYLAFVIVAVAVTFTVYFCFKQYLYIYIPNGILKGVF